MLLLILRSVGNTKAFSFFFVNFHYFCLCLCLCLLPLSLSLSLSIAPVLVFVFANDADPDLEECWRHKSRLCCIRELDSHHCRRDLRTFSFRSFHSFTPFHHNISFPHTFETLQYWTELLKPAPIFFSCSGYENSWEKYAILRCKIHNQRLPTFFLVLREKFKTGQKVFS